MERKAVSAIADFSPHMQNRFASGAGFLPLHVASGQPCECRLLLQLDGFHTLRIRLMHGTLRMNAR